MYYPLHHLLEYLTAFCLFSCVSYKTAHRGNCLLAGEEKNFEKFFSSPAPLLFSNFILTATYHDGIKIPYYNIITQIERKINRNGEKKYNRATNLFLPRAPFSVVFTHNRALLMIPVDPRTLQRAKDTMPQPLITPLKLRQQPLYRLPAQ